MLDGKDYMSLFIGALVTAAGLIPLLEKFTALQLGITSFLNKVFVADIAIYLVAGLGIYLAIEAIIEITNSSSMGNISLIVAIIITSLGIIEILHQFGKISFSIPILSPLVFQILFVVVGIFLMIACFAMEL